MCDYCERNDRNAWRGEQVSDQTTQEELNDFLSVEEVAQLLGFTRRTVQRWLADGRLEGFRVPGMRTHWRIPRSAIERVKHTAAVSR